MGCGPSKSTLPVVVPVPSEKLIIEEVQEVQEFAERANRPPIDNSIEDAAEAVTLELSQTIFRSKEIITEEPQSKEEQKLCVEGAADLGMLPNENITNDLLRYNKIKFPANATIVATFKNIMQYDGDVLQCEFSNNSNANYRIVIPCGQLFIPKDKSRTQNLILKYPIELDIPSKSKKIIVSYAFCGNSNFGCSSNKEMELSNFRFTTNVCTDQSLVWQKCRKFRADTRRGQPAEVDIDDEESGRSIQARANEQIQIRETILEKGKPLIVNCVESMKRKLSEKKELYSIDSLQVVEAKLVESIEKATDSDQDAIIQRFTEQCKVEELNNFGGLVVPNAEASLTIVQEVKNAICSISTQTNSDQPKKPKDQAQALRRALDTLRDIQCEQYFDELVPMVLGGDAYGEDVFESVLTTTSSINSIVEALLDLTEQLKPFADPSFQNHEGSAKGLSDSLIQSLIASAKQLKQELLDLAKSNPELCQAIENTWVIPSEAGLLSGGTILKRMSLHKKARLAIDEIKVKNNVENQESCLFNEFEQWFQDDLLVTNIRGGRGLSRTRSVTRTRSVVGGQSNLRNNTSDATLDKKMRDSTMAERLNLVKLGVCNQNKPVEAMASVYKTFSRGFGNAHSIYDEVYGCLNQMLDDYGLFDDFEEGTELSKELMGLLISPYLCDKINKDVKALETLLNKDMTTVDDADINERHCQVIEKNIEELEQDIQDANGGLLFSAIFDDRASDNNNDELEGRTTYTSVEKLIKKANHRTASLGDAVELSRKQQECDQKLLQLSKGDLTKTLDEQIKELRQELKKRRDLSNETSEYENSDAYQKASQTLLDFELLLEFNDEPLRDVFEEDGKTIGRKARQEWITNELNIRKKWATVLKSCEMKYKDGGETYQYKNVDLTKKNYNIIVALQEIENVANGNSKKKRSSISAKSKMIKFQERLNTPGLVNAAGQERIDDVRAAMVYAQIDRTLFSQLKNYNENGVKESTIKVVQCLLILLGFGSKEHRIKDVYEEQFKRTTKTFRVGFDAVSTWKKCRELLNLQKQCSLDWMLPGFRTTSLVTVDPSLMKKVTRILRDLKADSLNGGTDPKRQSSVVDTMFHWVDLVHNSWKRKQKRGSRQFSQRSMQPLNERANSLSGDI